MQTSGQRKSFENPNANSASSSNSSGSQSSSQAWPSPQSASSFSRFQDIEVPLGGTTELNDDAKEKSLRRRSLLDERAARRRSLLSYGAEDGDRRRSLNNNNAGGSSSNLASPGSKLRPSGTSSLLGVVESHQAPLPSLLKVSADSFEQWLKLATDNKINANNSWNFALIDYFHEMSLLREGDSINFQKASCTLDGCVKIYTSRVDSVATETTKLLGGLATSAKGPEQGGSEDRDEDDEEQDKPAKKKHANRSGNTLAKDFSTLSLEKFNLEFSVDPLFKKTSADFDEGGARGLLLNHLHMDAEGKIIFDAGDARDEGDDEYEDERAEGGGEDEDRDTQEQDENEISPEKKLKRKIEIESATIDIQRLRSKFLPSLNQIFQKDICPSLKDFQLTGTSDMDFSFLKRFHDENEDEDDWHAENNQDRDTFALDNFDDDVDFGNPEVYDPDNTRDHDMVLEEPKEEPQDDNRIMDAFGDLDDQIAAQRAGPAFDNNILDTDDLMVKGHPDMYSYFDAALLRNWAGPEHWKLRRISKDKAAPSIPAEGTVPGEEDVTAGTTKKRTGKVPLFINFTDAPEVDEDELFAPADASSLLFTQANEAENRKSKHVLPDDIHFSSKQLLRMFTKPSFIIKSKTRRHQSGYLQNPEQESFNIVFPDEEFWASHTNNVEDNDVAALTDQLDQTQIYNDYIEDDEDDYGFQEQGFFANVGGDNIGIGTMGGIGLGLGLGLDGDGNDYASQLVSQPKRVKAAFINFSKTAKKVDVKKLKDNIWKEMTQQALKRQPVGEDL
ncbi:condensin complex subunit 2/barren, partial [Lobosporangium transversale]